MPMDLNFRLEPHGKAVDAGVTIPTVNDGFTGRAPDLGALEVGKPEPTVWAEVAQGATVLSLTTGLQLNSSVTIFASSTPVSRCDRP